MIDAQPPISAKSWPARELVLAVTRAYVDAVTAVRVPGINDAHQGPMIRAMQYHQEMVRWWRHRI
jgi:hypothetical protein